MTLHIHIQPGDDIPIYRQLVKQVEAAVITGRVTPGERLPSQRELAQELVIAPLTVKRAYDELESNGYLRMERGRGTFACPPPQFSAEVVTKEIQQAIRRVVELAWQHQVDFEQISQMLTEADRQYQTELSRKKPAVNKSPGTEEISS
ncbi:MAG: GntR family transcriptional regulator [Planctomycetes bacterium]|nr:GntR family transcriptional regulator [Planctomycetota bacterium]